MPDKSPRRRYRTEPRTGWGLPPWHTRGCRDPTAPASRRADPSRTCHSRRDRRPPPWLQARDQRRDASPSSPPAPVFVHFESIVIPVVLVGQEPPQVGRTPKRGIRAGG